MIKALIVDDEKHCQELLAEIISKNFQDIEICGIASNVDEARALLKKAMPNLLFTDIQMPVKNGFDLLESREFLNLQNTGVIFTTAHDQYAIRAFRYAAIDYLLKPISECELVDAVTRFKHSYIQQTDFKANLALLKEFNKSKNLDRICLHSNKGMVFTRLSDILYMEAQGSYTNVYIQDHKTIMVSKPIINFERLLDSSLFLRIHRSYLVNIQHIIEYQPNSATLTVSNQKKIEVSVRKKQDLLKVLSGFLQP